MRSLIWIFLVSGCASSSDGGYNYNSKADGAAFSSDGMMFGKPMGKSRQRHLQFFHKSCTIDNSGGFPSTRNYGCDESR